MESLKSVTPLDELVRLQAEKIQNLLQQNEKMGADLESLRATTQSYSALEKYALELLPYRDFVVCSLDPNLLSARAKLDQLHREQRELYSFSHRCLRRIRRNPIIRLGSRMMRRVFSILRALKQA